MATNATKSFRKMTVLAALESAYGVEEVPTALDALLLYDGTITPLGAEKRERKFWRPDYGNRPSILVMKKFALSAKVELAGAGVAGTAPAWGKLLQASGCTQVLTPATPEATIAAAAMPGDGATGTFTYVRARAYGGTSERTVTLTCTTGGVSGAAVFTVAAPAADADPAYEATDQVMTDGAPFALPGGAEITPTVGTAFVAGDTYTIAVRPPEARYRPISDRNSHQSLTFWCSLGGERHRAVGVRATVRLRGQVGDLPELELSATGFFLPPDEVAVPTPDFAPWQDPREVSTDNTPFLSVFGHDAVMEEFGLDLANDVQLIERVGQKMVRIQDRKPAWTALIEAPGSLADKNFYAAVDNRDFGAVRFQHGRTAGGIVLVDLPRCQIDPFEPRESKGDLMFPLAGPALSTVSDDDVSIIVK